MAAENPHPIDERPGIILSRQPLTAEQRKQKKKLTRIIILICLCLIPLFVWFQSALFDNEVSLPVNSNILIFVLINVNVILVLLVLFLVLRNLAELFFERKQNLLGTKLKTKLVVSFISLSLIPTILLFFVALQFVSTSMDYWFNLNVENSLQESLKLAQSLLRDTEEEVETMGDAISLRLKEKIITTQDSEALRSTLQSILDFDSLRGPDSLSIITDKNTQQITVQSPSLRSLKLPKIPIDILQSVKKTSQSRTVIQEMGMGDLVRSINLTQLGEHEAEDVYVITSLLVKNERLSRMKLISQGIEGYRQLKHLKEPFKFWLFIVLLIVTLLIIFAAIWFGFYISKGITEPVDKLADATRRVAEGDLEFAIEGSSDDEIGLLVDSFNQMTLNLNISNKKLAETLTALHESSQESEQRRKYTEILLQNVSAGVISMDNEWKITTINHFAENLLNIDPTHYLNKRFQDTLIPEHAKIISGFIDELTITGKTAVEQYLRLNVLQKNYSLLINFTRLEDDDNNPLGFVLVFDDLTKIENMQRMAAWREVAKRIAHEIKNPLTPIQLSAQRLRRRYPDILNEEDMVFDQCTATIINQVDELKRLVSEFSQFARMPKVQKSPANLTKLAQDTLFLYREAHKHIDFYCNEQIPLPIFSFDSEQIKRCLINLLDNAVAVLPNGGKIQIELTLDDSEESAFIRVIDNGPGTSKEDKLKLFEPYFSTKKTGTGLGLAIVSTIISDHNGYIRVQDNTPHGSIFIIELPLFFADPQNT